MPAKLKVHFTAPLTTEGMTFGAFGYTPKPNEGGVARIELVGEDGREIRGEVHLDSVEVDKAREIAKRASDAALDRIAYHHDLPIGGTRMGPCEVIPSPPPSGVHLHAIEGGDRASFGGEAAAPVIPVDASDLKAKLEQAPPRGGRYFGLHRSALLSTGYVERFMHLYKILLMLHKDKQDKVDKFIRKERGDTPYELSGDPKHAADGKKETIYTRLRNEFAHVRPNVDPDRTKAEMAEWLQRLMELTKRAIALHR